MCFVKGEKVYAAVFEDDSFTKVAATDMIVGDKVNVAIVNKGDTAVFVKPIKCWFTPSNDVNDAEKTNVINNGCAVNVRICQCKIEGN